MSDEFTYDSDLEPGEKAWVVTSGGALVVVSEAVAPGDLVKVGNDGKAAKAGTISTIDDYRRILGRVVSGADADGHALIWLGK